MIQNAGTALFSFIAGPIADRFGYRLVVRGILLGVAALPLLAIAMAHWPAWGRPLYPAVFLLVGLTPVGFKAMSNYTLEICPPAEHPRYLSTLGLCYAAPLIFSPAVGWIVEAVGFAPVFCSVAGVVLAGWLTTFALDEPRAQFKIAQNRE